MSKPKLDSMPLRNLPPGLKPALEKDARKNERTLEAHVRFILAEYIEKLKKEKTLA